MYAIDLFSGAGGMSEGIIQSGFHIIYASDINDNVRDTYVNRHNQLGFVQGENTFFRKVDIRKLPSEQIKEDILSLNIFRGEQFPEIDAMFGGPPCQGFSRAGLRDKNDPRNLLFKEYLRIVNDIQPNYVVMENVEGFMDTKLDGFVGVKNKKYKDGMLIPSILQMEFDAIGYETLEPRILDASDFGVPQRRKRAIFLAYKKGFNSPEYPIETTPEMEQKVTVLEAIGDLISDERLRTEVNVRDASYQLSSRLGRTPHREGYAIQNMDVNYNHEFSRHSRLVRERFSLFRQGDNNSNVSERIKEEGIDLSIYPELLELCMEELKRGKGDILESFLNQEKTNKMMDTLLTKKANRFRLCQNGISPTMVTMPDDYLVPFENRIPTVREMARIQSFDDSFQFLGKRTTGGERRRVEVPQYTQVGNAVPPLLSKAIAMEVRRAIESN